MKKVICLCLILAFSLLIFGCSSSGNSKSVSLVAIQVTPSNQIDPVGIVDGFLATGIYSDNSIQDLTQVVVWSSSNNQVASINNQGLATTLSAGTTQISATFNGVSGNSNYKVINATVTSISISTVNLQVPVGLTRQFTAMAVFSTTTGKSLKATSTIMRNVTMSASWTSSNSNVGTINNTNGSATKGLLTALQSGTTIITASFQGVSVSSTVVVTNATIKSLSISPISPSVPKGLSKQFKATAVYSDNSVQDVSSLVTWSSSSTNIATISSIGLASTIISGSTTISANFAGLNSSTILTVTNATLSTTVSQPITITPINIKTPIGINQQYSAVGIFSDNSTQDITALVLWTSSSTNIATISNASGSHGLAVPVAAGSTTISATYGTVSTNTSLTVSSATLQSIAVTPVSVNTPLGISQQFTAIGLYSDNSTQNVTSFAIWTSSSTNIATISNAQGSIGLANPVSTGSTTITASINAVTSNNASLIITNAILQSIAITPSSSSVPKGINVQFTAIGIYSDSSTQNITTLVNWASSNQSIAVINNATNSQGLANTISGGSTNITASFGLTVVSNTATLTVTGATLKSIQVTPANGSTPLGITQSYTATGLYSDNTTQNLTPYVTWTSSSSSVAIISNTIGTQGVATPISSGVTTITAILGGVSNNVKLTVTTATLSSVSLTATAFTATIGSPLQITAMGTYSDGSQFNITNFVTWSSSNPTVATVSNAVGSQGLVTPLSSGTTTITATSSTGAIVGSVTVTVISGTLQTITITPNNPTIALNSTQQFTAIGNYSDGSHINITNSVTWVSATTSVATVSNTSGSNGLVTTLVAGTSTISATLGSISATSLLTVSGVTLTSISVTPANPSISSTSSQQFIATGTYSDMSQQIITSQVSWSSSLTSVATISSGGLANAVASGGTTITATLGSITGNTTLTVTSATLQSITVTPASSTLSTIGGTQQYTATGNYSDGTHPNITGSVNWGSTNTGVATISTGGLVTAANNGTSTITATDPVSLVSGNTGMTVSSVFAYITNNSSNNVLACPVNSNNTLGTCAVALNAGLSQYQIQYDNVSGNLFFITGGSSGSGSVQRCSFNGYTFQTCNSVVSLGGYGLIVNNPYNNALIITRSNLISPLNACGTGASPSSCTGYANGANYAYITFDYNGANLYYVANYTGGVTSVAANLSSTVGVTLSAPLSNTDQIGAIYAFGGYVLLYDASLGAQNGIYKCVTNSPVGTFSSCVLQFQPVGTATNITVIGNQTAFITTSSNRVYSCSYSISGGISGCILASTDSLLAYPEGIAVH